jgi:putative transposase
MARPIPLVEEQFYHIYKRGNAGEPLFRERRNYPYFLKLYAQYLEPVAETFAYCLLNNHFHPLVRIRCAPSYPPGRAFANLFCTYTKAFNRAYQRTGSLFEKPFRRILVDNDRYLTHLVTYIHHNPQKHGFVDASADWPYISYAAALSSQPTRVQRDEVLGWFGDRARFVRAHAEQAEEALLQPLVGGDMD